VKVEWDGIYFDGQSAQRHRVTVRPVTDGLHITLDDGTAFSWPYSEVRQAQGVYRGQQVRLERSATPEALVISDPDFLTALTQSASGSGRRFRRPLRASAWVTQTLLAGTAAILVTGTLYLWGIPTLADHVAARVPARWEAHLGQTVVEEITRQTEQCGDPRLAAALGEITATLTRTWTPSPYTFHVTVVDVPVINALAAPGGYIVVYRGLLEKTQAPEELAGVLAHEMQHVLHRDATKALVREMSVQALLTVATGGAGAMTPLQAAGILARLRYSREAEAAADRDGMKMMEAAHLDPQGMIHIYETLKKEGGQAPRAVAYLSTHPDIDSRIAELRRLAQGATYPPVSLLPGVRWETIAHACGPI
jgi:predicted Zn-dependent protease